MKLDKQQLLRKLEDLEHMERLAMDGRQVIEPSHIPKLRALLLRAKKAYRQEVDTRKVRWIH